MILRSATCWLRVAVFSAFFWLIPVLTLNAFAATSPSYQLDGSSIHAQSSLSNSYSLCSQFDWASAQSRSASYQLMPALDCVPVETGEVDTGGRRRHYCGNGLLDDLEQCDDGNLINGDGCSQFCAIEPGGPGPTGPPVEPPPAPICGNAIRETGEQCDDGNLINGDGCTATCSVEPEVPDEPVVPICGNAVLEGIEQCDDGNRVNGDGCNRRCRIEPERPDVPEVPEVPEEPELPDGPLLPAAPEEPDLIIDLEDYIETRLLPVCGNGELEFGESCDDGNRVNGDGCTDRCRIEVVLPPVVVAPEPLPETVAPDVIRYITNDPTTLFFEQFPEGTGMYRIELRDVEQGYDVRTLETTQEYFSLQLEDSLPDGVYEIRVEDLNRPEQPVEQFELEVRERLLISPPEVIAVDDVELAVVEDEVFAEVTSEHPVLIGKVPLSGTIALYSELLDETFIVYSDDADNFHFRYPIPLGEGSEDRLHMVALYENGEVSRERIIHVQRLRVHRAAEVRYDLHPLFWALLTMLVVVPFMVWLVRRRFSAQLTTDSIPSSFLFAPGRSKKMRVLQAVISALLILALAMFLALDAWAVTTTPNLIPYEGLLKDSGGTAITTAQDFRFSFWLDSDFNAGVDRDGAGAIPGGAPGFSSYSEVQTITPDAAGFFQVDIGAVAGTIPDFILTTHLYLQVEVKPDLAADTAYETLDIDGVDNSTDRQNIGTLPYARNADFIDNAELGTTSGDIAVLGAGDVFPTTFIPGGTNVDTFEIDANDDAAGNIELSFGDTLNNQLLEWDPNGVAPADGWFNFTDDVNITGDLTVTGTINGVTIGAQNKSVQLQPEFPNTTLDADGTSNRGKMEAFFIDTDGAAAPNNFNYYQWSTRQASLQDLDLVVRFRLPDDFTSFQATPLVLRYRTTDNVLTNNRIDVTVEDTTGTTVPGMAGNTALVSGGAFSTTNITFGGGTFTAGSEITIYIKLSTLSGNLVDVSDLTIHYIGQ